jgi:hypothetical protein
MAAPIGAPLTAPGRSEQHIPHKRESRDRKPATGQAKHVECPAALLTANRRSGAGCRNFARLQLDGEIFFLTSSFIELSRGFSKSSGDLHDKSLSRGRRSSPLNSLLADSSSSCSRRSRPSRGWMS